MSDQLHPSELDLAAFLDHDLTSEARRELEAHLVTCEECRALVAGTARLLPGSRPKPMRHVFVVGGLATAALLLLTLIPRAPVREPASETRRADSSDLRALRFGTQAPPDGALIRPDTLVFSWDRVAGDATYQLTISTETGAVVWTRQTADTSLPLPASVAVRLQPKKTYYWQVDALLPSLRSTSSPLRRFTPLAP
jgi:hypothetical protein